MMHLIVLALAMVSIAPVQTSIQNRQPQLASVPGLTTVVFGSGNSIWLAASRDDGHSFSRPAKVTDAPGVMLGRHRGPRVVISGNTLMVSAIYGGNLISWRSPDQGRTWGQPVTINDVPNAAREGLHAMAAGENGEIASVWLDLRSPGTRLYGSYSRDSGATWSKNALIYESAEKTICQCCGPSIAAAGPHKFEVMFRNAAAGMRDMYLADWPTDGTPSHPQKMGTGSWALDACPMDGGGLAHYRGVTETAWRRDQSVFLAEPGKPEVEIGEGKDIALALSDKGSYVAWTDSAGVQLHRPGQKAPLLLSPVGAFPSLTALANGSILAAWEQAGQVMTLLVE